MTASKTCRYGKTGNKRHVCIELKGVSGNVHQQASCRMGNGRTGAAWSVAEVGQLTSANVTCDACRKLHGIN